MPFDQVRQMADLPYPQEDYMRSRLSLIGVALAIALVAFCRQPFRPKPPRPATHYVTVTTFSAPV